MSRALVNALDAAHDASARRQNMSSVAVVNAAKGSGSYTCSIAAAMMTLGGTHGPLEATQRFLESNLAADHSDEILRSGRRVPGWGNGFIKGAEDPAWLPVREALRDLRPDLVEKIDAVTARLHACGKDIYPNPSAYTAACAIALGIPSRVCAFLFVSARLRAWTDLFLDATKEGE